MSSLGSNGTCRVLDAAGDHVGNVKWIGGMWKFKAIGVDASGSVIPGGGPLTDRHNTAFASLEPAQINKVLSGSVLSSSEAPEL